MVQKSDYGSYEPAVEDETVIETELAVEPEPAMEIELPTSAISENFQESEITESP